jgi:hypothetical protein
MHAKNACNAFQNTVGMNAISRSNCNRFLRKMEARKKPNECKQLMRTESTMKSDLIQAARALAKGQLFRIDDGVGQRIECLSGALWITQHNDPRDVILRGSEGFTIERGGATYVSALQPSTLVVLADATTAAGALARRTGRRSAEAAQ